MTVSPVIRQRRIPIDVRVLLFVKAGGRCEFDGCNKYLLRHHLTKTEGNFADMAHIVGFSKGGPRGGHTRRPEDIHETRNLMLVCRDCHKLIDDDPETYSVTTLKEYKRRHEKRIHHVTGLGPDMMTAVVQLKANIGGHAVEIPASQVTEAVAPRYPKSIPGTLIDLTGINVENEAYYRTAAQEIKRRVARIYEPEMEVIVTRHVSLFALAPIPLLVYLGCQLSNKIPVDPYQRHRNPEGWTWKRKGVPVDYEFRLLRAGKDRKKVALTLSMSGTIHLEDLPSTISSGFHVYEITLKGKTPNPGFLNLREDLARFGEIYRHALRIIQANHGMLKELHLFLAVPAPVAVFCGKELFPKVDPDLLVYDYDKARGGYSFALKIERSDES